MKKKKALSVLLLSMVLVSGSISGRAFAGDIAGIEPTDVRAEDADAGDGSDAKDKDAEGTGTGTDSGKDQTETGTETETENKETTKKVSVDTGSWKEQDSFGNWAWDNDGNGKNEIYLASDDLSQLFTRTQNLKDAINAVGSDTGTDDAINDLRSKLSVTDSQVITLWKEMYGKAPDGSADTGADSPSGKSLRDRVENLEKTVGISEGVKTEEKDGKTYIDTTGDGEADHELAEDESLVKKSDRVIGYKDDSTYHLDTDGDGKIDTDGKPYTKDEKPLSGTDLSEIGKVKKDSDGSVVTTEGLNTLVDRVKNLEKAQAGYDEAILNLTNENLNILHLINQDRPNIDTVADHIDNVDTVAEHINNVDTVATSIKDVNTVANEDNLKAIISAANGIDNINTIIDTEHNGTNLKDVNTVASNIKDVNSVAARINNKDFDKILEQINNNNLQNASVYAQYVYDTTQNFNGYVTGSWDSSGNLTLTTHTVDPAKVTVVPPTP